MITKNIALAGHAGTGKTTLMEALLYQGGQIERMGSVAAGNTVSDYTAEEMKRHSSIYTATGHILQNGQKINLLDTPGMFDFAGSMVQGISAADCVLITVSGKSGVRDKEGVSGGRRKTPDVCCHQAGRRERQFL